MAPKKSRKRKALTAMQTVELENFIFGYAHRLPRTHPIQNLTAQEELTYLQMARIQGTNNRYYHDTRQNMYFIKD